jgi:hypothetical protein
MLNLRRLIQIGALMKKTSAIAIPINVAYMWWNET